jgi:hypothetical protein
MFCELPEGKRGVVPFLYDSDELGVAYHYFPLVLILLHLSDRLDRVAEFDNYVAFFDVEYGSGKLVISIPKCDELGSEGRASVCCDHSLDNHLLSFVVGKGGK